MCRYVRFADGNFVNMNMHLFYYWQRDIQLPLCCMNNSVAVSRIETIFCSDIVENARKSAFKMLVLAACVEI